MVTLPSLPLVRLKSIENKGNRVQSGGQKERVTLLFSLVSPHINAVTGTFPFDSLYVLKDT